MDRSFLKDRGRRAEVVRPEGRISLDYLWALAERIRTPGKRGSSSSQQLSRRPPGRLALCCSISEKDLKYSSCFNAQNEIHLCQKEKLTRVRANPRESAPPPGCLGWSADSKPIWGRARGDYVADIRVITPLRPPNTPTLSHDLRPNLLCLLNFVISRIFTSELSRFKWEIPLDKFSSMITIPRRRRSWPAGGWPRSGHGARTIGPWNPSFQSQKTDEGKKKDLRSPRTLPGCAAIIAAKDSEASTKDFLLQSVLCHRLVYFSMRITE